jgi:TolA-binding protein
MFKSLAVMLLLSAAARLAAQEANDVDQPPSSVSSTIQQQLADLKARVDAEHQRIQELEQQLADRERGVNRLQEQMNELQTNSLEKQSGNNFPTEDSAASDSTGAPNVSDTEHPVAIRFRGITLTPGGFFDTTGIYRSHNENADVDSTFGGIPFSGTANAHVSEFRGSARASRLSLLAEGRINNWKASGYAEVDFEGAAPTANELESNSFNPRARQLWAQLEFNNGFSIAGGQTWSLLTTHRKGIELRQEMVPMTIDLQHVPGYNWARQWSLRVTKNFHKNMWAAFSV